MTAKHAGDGPKGEDGDVPGLTAATPRTDPPPSGPLGNPVVRATTPLAILGVLALITGRALAPALGGVSVGTGWLVHLVGLIGAVESQIFAFAAMMIAILAIMAVARSGLPLALRLAALSLGGVAVLPTMWALHEPVPEVSASLVAASASLLALCAVPTVIRAPFGRGPGLVLGLIALGGLVRVSAVFLAFQAHGPSPRIAAAIGALGTIALLCDVAAIAIALVWIASRAKKLTSPATVVALLVAAFVTRQALAGQNLEAGPFDLVCWRVAVRLLSTPDSSLPLALRLFVAVLSPIAAIVALTARDALAPLTAAVALALCARGAMEMPPCALMLVVAALGAALFASDGRSLWASLERGR